MISFIEIKALANGTKRDKTGHHPPVNWDMSQRHPKGGAGLSQTQDRARKHKERRGEDVTYKGPPALSDVPARCALGVRIPYTATARTGRRGTVTNG